MKRKIIIFIVVVAFLLVASIFGFNSRNSKPDEMSKTLTPVTSFSHSHGIAIDVADSSKLYIATHEGLFLLKDDKSLFRVGGTRDDLMGFSSHPTEENTFFSSGHPKNGGNIGFQKTIDGGISWTKISNGLSGPVDFHSMAVSTMNPDFVYGFFGGKIQKSIDQGKSWEYSKGTVMPLSLSTDPTDANVVYASTQNGVVVSHNQGDNWESVSPDLEGGVVSVFVLSPSDNQYALSFSEKLGGLGKSDNGGKSWKKISEDFGGETVLYISFSKVEKNIVYALTDRNSIYKSLDYGDTWVKIR